ncbi:4-carboxymuconolactone decarboxylase [Betaproteobacteria bacterium]|nr:4-carboxymuconolactone decarboxylase [Betaproteobacteria bacterium]
MKRPLEFDVEKLTTEQLAVYQDIVERRGSIPEPHKIWLIRPELARHAQELGWYLQRHAALPARLSEFATLLIGQHWRAEYVWHAHKPRAVEAGLPAAVIAAIEEQRQPETMEKDEALVYEFVTRLNEDRKLSPELYAKALKILGQDGVVDLTGIVGYFSLIAATIKVFEIIP